MGNNVQRCSRRLVNAEIKLQTFLFKKNSTLYDVKLVYKRTPDQVEPGYSYVQVQPAALKELPTTTHVHNVPPKEFDTEYESMYFDSPEMADKFMHELRNGYCFKCGHTSHCKEFYRNFDDSSSAVQQNHHQKESTKTKSPEKQIKQIGKSDKLPPDIRW